MEQDVETAALWAQMHERLLSYIRRRVGGAHDAEDIMQDVFLRIHTNLDRLNDTQSVTAWIYQIARNAITDYHRARAKAAGASRKIAEGADEDAHAPGPDGSPADEAAKAGADLAHCVEPLLQQLSDGYREALVLTEFDGLTQKQAAEELGLSVPGVKARVQRGRGKLKALLQDCCNVELDRRRGVVDYEPRDSGACSPCPCEDESADADRQARGAEGRPASDGACGE